MAKDKVQEAEEPKGQTVEVDAAKLKEMMNRLERLETVASKAGLQRYDDAHKEKLQTKVNMRFYEDKPILATQLIKDIVEKNPNTGNWTEEQTLRLIFKGDEILELPYETYVRRHTLKPATVLAKTETDTGVTIYKIKLDDGGEEFEIDVRFLN